MDSGGENRFFSGCNPIIENSVASAAEFLRFQIIFIEQGRSKELADTDAKALAHLMDHSQLYGVIGAVYNIPDGGSGNTAIHKQLILGHALFVQQLCQPFADCLIQFQIHHRPCACTIIVQRGLEILVPVAVLFRFFDV